MQCWVCEDAFSVLAGLFLFGRLAARKSHAGTMSDYKLMKMAKSTGASKDFKVSDEDESCVGAWLDPCGVCITKGQARDGTK